MMLTVEQGLTIGYKRWPIATVTNELRFEPGQVTLLLGLNGQGKTTFMKTLAGLLPPIAGKLSQARVFYLSDDVDFPANLTPRQIVSCFARNGKFLASGEEMLNRLEVQDKKYGVLSKGNRQKARLVFAEVITRVRQVEFLGLDEPFAGLDFQAREVLIDRWLEHRDQNRHLLISMHDSETGFEPSQIILVSQGKICAIPPSTPWREIRALLQKSAEPAAAQELQLASPA